jgi:3-phenylpropionate/trans-cinnamate dioxygenase ferredoxin component
MPDVRGGKKRLYKSGLDTAIRGGCMGNYVKAVNVNDLKDGEKKKITLEGHDIMLARLGNKYYAVANRCPHLGGNLSHGTLEGTVITCPLHGSQYDITTGKVIRWTRWKGLLYNVNKAIKKPRGIKTYNVRLEKDTILVEV